MCSGIEEAVSYFENLAEEREYLPYEIDGMVIKVKTCSFKNSLAKSRGARAGRLLSNSIPMTSRPTCWIYGVNVGRTGIITPVAFLNPVLVGGVTVKRATLHNIDEIERKDIRKGDAVIVHRAGDVIPEVIEVIKSGRTGEETPFRMPQRCPSCGSPVVRLPDEAFHRCVNRNCPAQIKGSIVHFASRDAMNIEGLGERIVSGSSMRGSSEPFRTSTGLG